MTESNIPKSDENIPEQASSPDDLVKDLDATISESDANSVVGGRKAGKEQQEYLIVKLNDAIIT